MRERLGYTPPEEKKGTVESGHKAQWEAWQKEGRERFNAARRDHERASQEYLVKAEQAEAAEQLYQVFLDAKFWHHQEDIIKQAGLARNQKNFEFLSLVAASSKNIPPNWDKNEKFYEDEDYIRIRGFEGEILNKKIKEESRWTAIGFDDMLNSDDFIVDYEEYLIRILARSFGQYHETEYRNQAEENLLLLLKRIETKEEETIKEYRESFPPDDHPEEQIQAQDYVTDEWMAQTFGHADIYFGETYADIIQSIGEVGSKKSIKPIVELTSSKPVELIGVMARTLSKLAPAESAKAVFSKYGEIVDQTAQITKFIKEQFSTTNTEPRLADKIAENLLRRGNELLMRFANLPDMPSEDVIRDLEHIKAEVLLFAATFREVSKQKDFSVEEFMTKSIEIKDSAQLTEEEKQRMLSVFKSNRDFYPDSLREITSGEFNKILNEPGHEFRILKNRDNVIAFIGVDYRLDGSVYAHSFNLDRNAKGTSVAINMVKSGLDQIGRDHDVEAAVYVNNPILGYYKKFLGFKVVGETTYHGSEEKYIKLLRPKIAKQEQAGIAA